MTDTETALLLATAALAAALARDLLDNSDEAETELRLLLEDVEKHLPE